MNLYNEHGSQIVEFALVLPILMTIFLSIIEFGYIYHQQIQIDNAVRMGARRGAVGVDNTSIIQSMKNQCSFLIDDNEITIDVRDINNISIGDPNDRTPDNYIYVAIEKDPIILTPLGATFNIKLHSHVEFLIE
jgi:hypothetical protein